MKLYPIIALASVLALASVAHAQLPTEIAAQSRDDAEDLLCLFSWALDIKFTDAEKERFVKERMLEWESGDNGWQSAYLGDYWEMLVTAPQDRSGRKGYLKRFLPELVLSGARAAQPEMIWIQKRLGEDDDVEELPVSGARRTPLEKREPREIVDTKELGGDSRLFLRAKDVADCLKRATEMFEISFTLEQRAEFLERAKKHWRKNHEDWGTSSFSKTAFGYLHSDSDFMVYRSDLDRNIKKLREFAERGDRDSLWLLNIYENSYQRQPLIPTEPKLSRKIVAQYGMLRAMQINEVVGRKVAFSDIRSHARIVKEVVAKWPTFSAAKRAMILDAPQGLYRINNTYSHFTPLYQEYQKHLWGQDMVVSIPKLKPLVEARSAEFARIAKKNPNWKAEMEANNQAAFTAFLQKNEEAFQRQMKAMDRMYDSIVFSNKISAINNAILRAPVGTEVRIDIRP